MELKDTVAALKASITKLPTKDQGFASSLVMQFEAKGYLSPKQQSWVEKLLSWATGKPTPEKTAVSVGSFGAVYALFAKAKEHLKYPKIKLLMIPHDHISGAACKPLVLALAGAKSKIPGVVNLTDGGKFGENVWYGRVYPDGKLECNTTVADSELKKVQEILVALALDPAKVVTEHGKLTGNCSFCDSPLSHENSTAVGYGPVCAKHFGLYDQWKAAALMAGLTAPDIQLAHTKSETKKVVFPKDPMTLAAKMAAADPAGKVAKVVAEEIVSRGKKKMIVDKERDDYLF